VPPIESLERLADSFAALERPVERKRMLVIVNPYATTVSDRLKNLVVYALQGRYEVDAMDTEGRDHATVLCRRGRRGGLRRGRRLRGDGHRQRGRQRPRRTPPPADPLPGGAPTSTARCSASPPTSSTPPSILLRPRRRLDPRPVDLATSTARGFTFSAGFGLDASVVRRGRRPSRRSRPA
jgi:diacylglycerol kinase family enzyme